MMFCFLFGVLTDFPFPAFRAATQNSSRLKTPPQQYGRSRGGLAVHLFFFFFLMTFTEVFCLLTRRGLYGLTGTGVLDDGWLECTLNIAAIPASQKVSFERTIS